MELSKRKRKDAVTDAIRWTTGGAPSRTTKHVKSGELRCDFNIALWLSPWLIGLGLSLGAIKLFLVLSLIEKIRI